MDLTEKIVASVKKGLPKSESAYTPRDQEVATMAHGNVTDEELAELIRHTAEAASALIRGDIRTYLTLVPHAEDYTLMDPFGGEPTRGFDASSESLEALELLSGWGGGAGTGGVIHVGR